MAKALFKLGRFSYLHKWTVIIAWFLILAGLGGAAVSYTHLTLPTILRV